METSSTDLDLDRFSLQANLAIPKEASSIEARPTQ
jgi:hypothetical protein